MTAITTVARRFGIWRESRPCPRTACRRWEAGDGTHSQGRQPHPGYRESIIGARRDARAGCARGFPQSRFADHGLEPDAGQVVGMKAATIPSFAPSTAALSQPTFSRFVGRPIRHSYPPRACQKTNMPMAAANITIVVSPTTTRPSNELGWSCMSCRSDAAMRMPTSRNGASTPLMTAVQ